MGSDLLRFVLRRTRGALRGVELFIDRALRRQRLSAETADTLPKAPHGQMQVYQVQKLASIGEMTVGIAHELNGPAAYINTNLSTLSRYAKDLTRLFQAADAAGAEPEAGREEFLRLRRELDADFLLDDLRKTVEESQEGVRRVLEFVRMLRDFSRADEAEMKLAQINDVVENAIRLSWGELKYKATVYRDYAPVPPVLCNAQRVGQVFTNMLVNAAQAIARRGEIRVSTREEQGFAVVRIRDTGRGIDPANLPRIFNAFFTTKPPGQGTGLGLHLAHQTVTAHGGKIDVTTRVGVGTEFAVRLPLHGPRG